MDKIQGIYVLQARFTLWNGKTWEMINSVHAAHLTVDVLQDLGVGLVLGSVAAERALRESTSRGHPNSWVLGPFSTAGTFIYSGLFLKNTFKKTFPWSQTPPPNSQEGWRKLIGGSNSIFQNLPCIPYIPGNVSGKWTNVWLVSSTAVPWSCPKWSFQDTSTGWTGRGRELPCSSQPAASVGGGGVSNHTNDCFDWKADWGLTISLRTSLVRKLSCT